LHENNNKYANEAYEKAIIMKEVLATTKGKRQAKMGMRLGPGRPD
jgi:hypothetical protein